MPVFISYSHQDQTFVERLAMQLVAHKANIWLDKWELRVGDSLIDKIQQAIRSSSALLVVLSKNSTQSEWCRRELNAGLVRELNERQVIVLPVLLEDCEIPMFLQEKMYADFRTDFDAGLRQVLEAIASVTTNAAGRIEEPRFKTDWAFDWGYIDRKVVLQLTMVDHSDEHPYTILTSVLMVANHALTLRYEQYSSAGLERVGQLVLLEALGEIEKVRDLRILITDEKPVDHEYTVGDSKTGFSLDITVTARRLGEDTGKDTLMDVGTQIKNIRDTLRNSTRPLNDEERTKLREIVGRPGQSGS